MDLSNNQTYGTLMSSSVKYKVVSIRYSVQVFQFYFHLSTLTYSPKCHGLLITFSLIMWDLPRVLLSLSTWSFLAAIGREDHPKAFLPKALFCQSTPSWLLQSQTYEIILQAPGNRIPNSDPIPSLSAIPRSLTIPVKVDDQKRESVFGRKHSQ